MNERYKAQTRVRIEPITINVSELEVDNSNLPTESKLLKKLALVGAKDEGMQPHEFLKHIMNGHPVKQKSLVTTYNAAGVEQDKVLIEEDIYPSLEVRLEAAKCAAPYYAPKLSAQAISFTDESKNKDVKTLTDEELMKIIHDIEEQKKLVP